MNKMNKFMIACFALFLIGSVVFADDVVYDAITYPFASGTKAMAADVNAAFDEVEASVNDNNTRITGLEVSTLDGVSNVGGDIDIVGGTEITITSDDTLNTITISAPSDLAHKDGTLQTNLNADMLDTLSESSFFRLNQSEVVAGRPSFNGGTSGSTSPFNVDSNTVVTNLNADMLDGYHYSSFIRTTGGTITGNLTVNSSTYVGSAYRYSSARTYYLDIPVYEFHHSNFNATSNRLWYNFAQNYLYLTAGSGTSYLAAPVYLPHGATITALYHYVYDGTSTSYLTSNTRLYYRPVTSTSYYLIGTATYNSSAATNSTAVFTGSVGLSHSVSNANTYYVNTSYFQNAVTSSLRFYGIRIRYTMSYISE